MSSNQLKLEREALKRKKRKLWNDNDGNAVWYYNTEFGWPVTKESFLGSKIGPHRGLGNHIIPDPSDSQLDTYVLNVYQMSMSICKESINLPHVDWQGDHPFYGTKEQDGSVTPDADGFVDISHSLYEQFGQDGLDITAEFGKANGIEVFAGFRLNDTHDFNFNYEELLPTRQFFWDNGGLLYNGVHNGYNFEVKAVRDAFLSLLDSILGNDDLTGIHIDFWRDPSVFKNTSISRDQDNRGLVTQYQIDIMTEFMIDVRGLIDSASTDRITRGVDPLLLSIKTPESEVYCKNIGFDIEKWASLDLFDLWVVGGMSRFDRITRPKRLSEKWGIPFYVSVEDQRIFERGMTSPEIQKAWKGYTRMALKNSDGAFVFNRDYNKDPGYFGPSGPYWRDFGSEITDISERFYYATYTGFGTETSGARLYYPPSFYPEWYPLISPRDNKKVSKLKFHIETGETDVSYSSAELHINTKSDEATVLFNGELLEPIDGSEGVLKFNAYGFVTLINLVDITFNSSHEVTDFKIVCA